MSHVHALTILFGLGGHESQTSKVAQQEEPFSRAQEQMERAESSPMSRAATPVTLTCTLGGIFDQRTPHAAAFLCTVQT
eukprot:4361693-Amphidinium_carterae.1